MAETWVNVYRTPAEMLADVAAAATHGWYVIHQRPRADGTVSVTFARVSELGVSPAAAPPHTIAPAQGMSTEQRALAVAMVVVGLACLVGSVLLGWLSG